VEDELCVIVAIFHFFSHLTLDGFVMVYDRLGVCLILLCVVNASVAGKFQYYEYSQYIAAWHSG